MFKELFVESEYFKTREEMKAAMQAEKVLVNAKGKEIQLGKSTNGTLVTASVNFQDWKIKE